MRQSIRALGWATKVLWIATAVFIVTSLYSPLKLVLERQIEIGSPQVSLTDGTLAVSLPFFVNNTGFYDISDLNITTSVADYDGRLISMSTTFVQNMPRGGSVNETHTMSVSLAEIMSRNLTHLLFNDTRLNVNASVGLRLAHVIPLQVSTMMNMSWGAPLYNFPSSSVEIPCKFADLNMIIPLSFENHADFPVNGTIQIIIYDSENGYLGSQTIEVNVPPHSSQPEEQRTIHVSRHAERGRVIFLFDTWMFDFPVARDWVSADD